MQYILGIDLGTSGTKTVLFDSEGKKIASSTVEYDLIQPQNGWAEQDPNDWWEAAVATTKQVLSKSEVNPSDIKGIGISGQMHGLVMVDQDGKVIRNAILWCDGRTTEECAEITETIGKEKLIEISANPALTGFTAGKVLWVKKNEPENYKRCKKILLPKDYIRFMLTGEYGGDVSDASGTNLFDVKNRKWSDEIIQKLGLNREMFPDCGESVDVAGTVTAKASETTGLSQGTIVCYGAGDNASAAIGTGVIEKGKAFTTIGTSGVIFAHSDAPQIDIKGRVHTFCSAIPGAYTVMSCTLAAGMSLKWFKDNLCSAEVAIAEHIGKDTYQIIDQGVARIPIGSNKLIFLPYIMGERSPILDEKSRGVFFGLSGVHTKYHMLRSIMEGVAYSQKQNFELMKDMEISFDTMYACGGGGKSEIWRSMLADLYETAVVTLQNDEGPALGVAILASVASGIYPDIKSACDKMIKVKTRIEPTEQNSEKYKDFYKIYVGLYDNLKDSFKALSEI